MAEVRDLTPKKECPEWSWVPRYRGRARLVQHIVQAIVELRIAKLGHLVHDCCRASAQLRAKHRLIDPHVMGEAACRLARVACDECAGIAIEFVIGTAARG